MDKVMELAKALTDSTKAKKKTSTSAYDTSAEVVAIEGSTAWVRIPGGVERTPATMAIDAKVGDTVRLRVTGGKAYVMGNPTSPPTDDSYAKKAEAQALRAAKAADSASVQAGVAKKSADSAIKDAETANKSANKAVEDASTAKESAEQAVADAATAHDAADAAQASADAAQADADIAKTNAQSAIDSATAAQDAADRAEAAVSTLETEVSGLDTRVSTAEGDITSIEGNITTLDGRLDTAEGDISTIEGNITTINGQISDISDDIDDIEGDVSGLTTRVGTAEGKVTTLEGQVSTAQTNITNLQGRVSTAESGITAVEGDIITLQGRVSDAEEDIDATFRELAVAQDVVGTINWITNHGTMTNQAGQTFDSNQVYFVVDANGDYLIGSTRYSVVSEPVAADIANYYLLSISESVQNYVATHIVVDSEGLWIIPDAGGNKVLIATGGSGHAYSTAGTYIVGKVNNIDTVLAGFTADGATIGKSADSHLDMDFHSLKLIDKETNTYVHLSDLRGSDGLATLTEHFVGTGTEQRFQCQCNPVDAVSAKVNGVELSPSSYTYGNYLFLVESPPPNGADIAFTYKTNSQYAKAFTLGVRNLNSDIGGHSYALGLLVESSGFGSFAEGGDTTASGTYSHAEGHNTTAEGVYSHAEGASTTASGNYSHAEGVTTTASGNYSHAEGYKTTASGKYSHAQNWGTVAQRASQTVVGQWNVPDTQGADTNQRGKYAFLVGNGTNFDNLSNAFGVDWDGNIECYGNVKDGGGNVLANKANTSSLATVATSGSYNDLSNTPTIPTISGLLDIFYPVGSYYETSDSTFDPNTAWGGTWSLETAGQVHVSAGTGYAIGATGGSKDAVIPYHNHGFTNPTISEETPTSAGPSNNTSGTPSNNTSGTPSNNTSAAMSANSTVSGTFDLRKWNTSGSLVVARSGSFTEASVSGTANSYASNGTNNGTVQRITFSKDISHTHSLQNHTHSLQNHTHSLQSHTHTVKHSHTASGGSVGYAGTSGNVTNANMQPYIVVNRWHRTA